MYGSFGIFQSGTGQGTDDGPSDRCDVDPCSVLLQQPGDAGSTGRLTEHPLALGQVLIGFENLLVLDRQDVAARLFDGIQRPLPGSGIADSNCSGDGFRIFDGSAMNYRS